jgi:zinc protease
MAWLESYGERIDALELETIQATAKQYLTPDVLTWVIVGDLTAIETQIRELNLGEVVILDADGQPIE